MTTLEHSPGRPRLRVPEVMRDVVFRRYWGAHTVSLLGDQITLLAIPLVAVLALDASAAEMGYLTALALLPNLLFALHAGAWVDRFGRRRLVMIACDLGRAVLLASIPVSYALGALSFPNSRSWRSGWARSVSSSPLRTPRSSCRSCRTTGSSTAVR